MWNGESSYELESHGGFARTVTGTVAYVDEEAQTFLVREPGGAMQRVPLRDITDTTAKPGTPENGRDREPVSDHEGLGTGGYQPPDRTSHAASGR